MSLLPPYHPKFAYITEKFKTLDGDNLVQVDLRTAVQPITTKILDKDYRHEIVKLELLWSRRLTDSHSDAFFSVVHVSDDPALLKGLSRWASEHVDAVCEVVVTVTLDRLVSVDTKSHVSYDSAEDLVDLILGATWKVGLHDY